jgi:hypothetical protein
LRHRPKEKHVPTSSTLFHRDVKGIGQFCHQSVHLTRFFFSEIPELNGGENSWENPSDMIQSCGFYTKIIIINHETSSRKP